MDSVLPELLLDNYALSNVLADDTIDVVIQKYRLKQHIRHDCLHVFLCEMTGADLHLGISNPIWKVFNTCKEYPGNLTPDIVLKKEKKIWILDVACTWNPEFTKNEKTEKYKVLCDFLKKQENLCDDVELRFYCLKPDLSNIDQLNEQFSELFIHQQSYVQKEVVTLVNRVTIMQTEIVALRDRIPKELLEDSFADKFPSTQFLGNLEMENILEKNLPGFHEQLVSTSTQFDAESFFETLVTDNEVRNALWPHKTIPENFTEPFAKMDPKYNIQYEKPKPSLHIPYAPLSERVTNLINKANKTQFLQLNRLEQIQVTSFITTVTTYCTPHRKEPWFKLLEHIKLDLIKVCENEADLNIFETGFILGNEELEEKLDIEYKEFVANLKNNSKISTMSKKEFAINNKYVNGRLINPQAYKNKCIKLSNIRDTVAKNFFEKAGVKFNEKNKDGRKYTSSYNGCNPDSFVEVDKFLDLIEEKPLVSYTDMQLLDKQIGVEDSTSMKLKSNFIKEFHTYVKMLSNTHVYNMAYYNHLVANQLLHFSELNTVDNTLYMMTSGSPHTLTLVQGGSVKRGSDIGQPFMTLSIVDDERWSNSIFGKIKSYPFKVADKVFYILVSNWRRLSSSKLSFIRDQYYSTLSTGFDSWTRVRERLVDSNKHKLLRFSYTIKTIVSLCTTQQVAEHLMDTRYMVMACLSDYSSIHKLIEEKFKPPYQNTLDTWIIHRLKERIPMILAYVQSNPPQKYLPVYRQDKRMQYSVGGIFNIPSIWCDLQLDTIQELFDEIFIYVHTPKEPSSNYFESVKAINTILKFQTTYDSLNANVKNGFATVDEFKQILLSKSQIGCSAPTILFSSRLFSQRLTSDIIKSQIIDKTQKESIGELTSTKAVIPEIKRIKCPMEYTNREQKKVKLNKENWEKAYPGMSTESLEVKMNIKFDESEEGQAFVAQSMNNRSKVHDALTDSFIRLKPYGEKGTVLDLANWHMKENGGKVIADICIKAQYGAKREFYVLNLGAKAMARVLENSYQVICKHTPQEMISIPGDKKFERMQQSQNECIKQDTRQKDDLMFFSNGDCTKWSACETMQSFIAMNIGLKTVFGAELTNYNNTVFSAWANKKITIPLEITRGIKYFTEKTNYIKDSEDLSIKSTQNFLQGMFNYSSSLKAVISTEFAIHMWRKIYPKRYMVCFHMEHSDDYQLTVRVRNRKDFEEFIVFHKLSQKLHGINDSEKKTNHQRYMMEFISLFSFNGEMSYPHIKKTKEVGLNLSCTGYKQDCMAIVSRVGEAVRVGVKLESAYIMQRIHCANIQLAYSTGVGQKNCMNQNQRNLPLEMFGIPDCNPICYPLVKGDPNAYRLLKFGNTDNKKMYTLLYKMTVMAIQNQKTELVKDEVTSFYSPTFSYPLKNNRIKALQSKTKLQFEDVQRFWEENPEYVLLKPVDNIKLEMWLKCMYFNKTFLMAYHQISRATMCLRHSRFSTKPCITFELGELKPNTYYKIKKAFEVFEKNFLGITDEEIKKYLPNVERTALSGSSNIQAFYSTMVSTIVGPSYTKPLPPIAGRLPYQHKWLELENNVSNVFQYIVNKGNFEKDCRKYINEVSIFRDVLKIEEYFDLNLLRTDRGYLRQAFKETVMQTSSLPFGLHYCQFVMTMENYVLTYLEHGCYNDTTNIVRVIGRTEVIHPKKEDVILTTTSRGQYSTDAMTIIENLSTIYHFLMDIQAKPCLDDSLTEWMLSLVYNLDGGNFPIKDFLLDVTEDKIFSSGGTLQHWHIIMFLKIKLLGPISGYLEELKGKSMYKHKYVTNSHTGIEELHLVYNGYKYKAYNLGKDVKNGLVIMEFDQYNLASIYSAYNIALRHFDKITYAQMVKRLRGSSTGNIPIVPENELEQFKSYSTGVGQPFVGKIGTLITTMASIDEGQPLPFLKNRHLRLTVDLDPTLLDIPIDINSFKRMITCGTLPILKLPIFNLSQHQVVFSTQESFVNEKLNIHEFLNTGLLFSYFTSRSVKNKSQQELVVSLVKSFPQTFECTEATRRKNGKTSGLTNWLFENQLGRFHLIKTECLKANLTIKLDPENVSEELTLSQQHSELGENATNESATNHMSTQLEIPAIEPTGFQFQMGENDEQLEYGENITQTINPKNINIPSFDFGDSEEESTMDEDKRALGLMLGYDDDHYEQGTTEEGQNPLNIDTNKFEINVSSDESESDADEDDDVLDFGNFSFSEGLTLPSAENTHISTNDVLEDASVKFQTGIQQEEANDWNALMDNNSNDDSSEDVSMDFGGFQLGVDKSSSKSSSSSASSGHEQLEMDFSGFNLDMSLQEPTENVTQHLQKEITPTYDTGSLDLMKALNIDLGVFETVELSENGDDDDKERKKGNEGLIPDIDYKNFGFNITTQPMSAVAVEKHMPTMYLTEEEMDSMYNFGIDEDLNKELSSDRNVNIMDFVTLQEDIDKSPTVSSKEDSDEEREEQEWKVEGPVVTTKLGYTVLQSKFSENRHYLRADKEIVDIDMVLTQLFEENIPYELDDVSKKENLFCDLIKLCLLEETVIDSLDKELNACIAMTKYVINKSIVGLSFANPLSLTDKLSLYSYGPQIKIGIKSRAMDMKKANRIKRQKKESGVDCYQHNSTLTIGEITETFSHLYRQCQTNEFEREARNMKFDIQNFQKGFVLSKLGWACKKIMDTQESENDDF